MAADVRIPIENYEILLPTMNDEGAFVVRRVTSCRAEDTGGIGIVWASGADVIVPPGTPEYFHELIQREAARVARDRSDPRVVDQFLQLFSGFEVGDAFGGDIYRVTCLRIAAAARSA